MEKQIITFSANEQKLIKTGGIECYASNIVSYIEAHFALGDNWSGYDSVEAVWWNDYVRPVRTVLDTEGVCIVPPEVLMRKSVVFVNLVGVIASGNTLTDRLTTAPITALTVKFNAQLGEGTATPITPSDYQQFVATVKADADRAEDAKDSARVYAGNALSSAQNALVSETNASASEDNAKASELNAETYKNQAQTYAQNANNSAISAENAKDEAEDARDTILGMRAEATTLPEGSSATASYNDGVMSFGIPKGDTGARGATGETGATPQLSIGTVETTTEPSVTITGTAENPVLNFGLVKGDKGDTGEVSLADLSTLLPTDTASGSIASFPDGQSVIPALSVLADIEPIQDLHGYDKPWSGGAGKNKFSYPYTIASSGTINGVTYTVNGDGSITLTGTATGQADLALFSPNGYSLDSGTYKITLGGIKNGIKWIYGGSGGALTYNELPHTVADQTINMATSGTCGYCIIRIANGTETNTTLYPMIRLSSVTDASFEPYTNICPISGRTEVVTSVVGKNLIPYPYKDSSTTRKGVTWTVNTDGTLSAHGTATATSWFALLGGNSTNTSLLTPLSDIGLKAGDTLTLSSNYAGWVAVQYNKADGSLVSSGLAIDGGGSVTAAIPNVAVYVYIGLRVLGGTTIDQDNIFVQLEKGSTATDYEAYDGHTYTTTLGRTVYGGTLDVVTGELVVDRAIVDMGDLSWGYNSTYKFFTADATGKKKGTTNLITSQYPYGNVWNASTDFVMAGNGAYNTVYVKDSRFTDAPTFKAAMSGVQLCYELATPQTYQLDPTEVDLLLGQNNLWTDCGAVEVTYKADVGLYIDKKLSNSGTRSLSMGLTKSATAEAETETEPSKTEAETKAEETKTEPSKTETDKTETR